MWRSDISKNVLIISASPRRGGNSETLADEFARARQMQENNRSDRPSQDDPSGEIINPDESGSQMERIV